MQLPHLAKVIISAVDNITVQQRIGRDFTALDNYCNAYHLRGYRRPSRCSDDLFHLAFHLALCYNGLASADPFAPRLAVIAASCWMPREHIPVPCVSRASFQ